LRESYGARLSFKEPWRAEEPGGGSARPKARKTTAKRQSAKKNSVTQVGGAPYALDAIGPQNSGAAASLRAGLETVEGTGKITVAGSTSTTNAADAVADPKNNPPIASKGRSIEYVSFSDNNGAEQKSLCGSFPSDGPVPELVFMIESGTVFGQSEQQSTTQNLDPRQPYSWLSDPCSQRIVIRFPRNISLLRNAETEDLGGGQTTANAPPAPYLRLSLKDSSEDDTVPPFSAQVTPYSQEAQWMSIVRELTRARVNTIVVSATNSLDELFLVKSLHRDVPDARAVVYDGGDLLFARVGDDQAYLGTVTLGVYPETELTGTNGKYGDLLSFADAFTEGLFNAAAYTFWDGKDVRGLRLAGYRVTNRDELAPPPLWATAVGRDGYYPLGIVSRCASDSEAILPKVTVTMNGNRTEVQRKPCDEGDFHPRDLYPNAKTGIRYTPGFSWYLICLLIAALGVAQTIALLTANYWSALTRDLDFAGNDQPRRRTVYVNIATAALISMCAISVIPAFVANDVLRPGGYTRFVCWLTVVSTTVAVIATVRKTWGYWGRQGVPAGTSVVENQELTDIEKNMHNESVFYPIFNATAVVTAIVIPVTWWCLSSDPCSSGENGHRLVGLFFAYRCLYPVSGVSPMVPVLLVLATWYIWAALQTRRLQFAENVRPVLPARSRLNSMRLMYVSDESLSDCAHPIDHCLYENIECLLITRQLIRRQWTNGDSYLNWAMAVLYAGLFVCFIFFVKTEGVAHFLHAGAIQPYEVLVRGLFFPLLIVSIAGGIRMMVIWSSFRWGLLEPLERSPLRFAFSRLTNVGWMTMLRQGGMFEHWRDLARSRESMQELVRQNSLWHQDDGTESCARKQVKEVYGGFRRHIALLLSSGVGKVDGSDATANGAGGREDRKELRACLEACLERVEDVVEPKEETFRFTGRDVPRDSTRMALFHAIELDCARFAEILLHCVLAPYWITQRHCLVEAESAAPSGFEDEAEPRPIPKQPEETQGLEKIHLAEEYVAIRYVSLIRAVMINLRLLMTFVSVSFVLTLLAWNSYPFQPKQWVDWTFTILLFGFGTGVVWVLAQMYRSPILSRITGTKLNELGGEFFWRIVTYGAVPVLTWVGSQFPAIGNLVSKLLLAGFATAK
jgi:hypothetical protein